MSVAPGRATELRAALVGVCAGVLSGLFGVGGGFIMVPLYVLWLGVEQKRAHATSLAAIIPIASTAAVGYAFNGEVDWAAVVLVMLGSVAGANYGVRLLARLELRTIRIAFCILLILTTIRLLWSAQPHQVFTGFAGHLLLVLIGVFAGVMAGLFGVGGGIVIVPALMLTSGSDATLARGTSLAVIVGSAISGTIAHFRRRNPDHRLAIITGVAGIPAAIASSYVGSLTHTPVLVWLFCLILLYTAWRMSRTE
jgi:uncharacterized membrane protein YfcA